MLKNTAADFNKALQKWFRAHGRVLPWRSNPSPYAVLVSEFMLQQTTVAAVQPYFQRWMKRFPDVASLAAAPEEEVMKHWEGLGYYSRARNLHRAAKAIVSQFAGVIPSDLDLLRALPGVGPYTASAIVAFAFDKPVPVLDAYILHASALMDLGATLCRAGEPDCAACPVKAFCRATNPSLLPVKPAKKTITQLEDWRAVSMRKGGIFLIPSPGPTWKGLWLLPPGEPSSEPLAEISYAITRYKVQLRLVQAEPIAGWQAFSLQNLPPMPSPHRRAIEAVLARKNNL